MSAHAQPQYVVDERGRRVAVIVPVEEYEALLRGRKQGDGAEPLSFSDLVGKLEWAGDPLAVQRQLRDEW